MKRNNKKGFTLAELLIVVAIIAVLVAVAIPVFTTQLENSREATDQANIRSAYAQAVADYLDNSTIDNPTITLGDATFSATTEGTGENLKIKVTMTDGFKCTCTTHKYTSMTDNQFD